MYQIIGVQKDQSRSVVATLASAGEAMKKYRALQADGKLTEVLILSPEGGEIDGYDLSRRYAAEERARYA